MYKRLSSRLAQKLNKAYGNLLYYRIVRMNQFHGLDALFDIELRTESSINVFFDVGANIGQSAKVYARRYPKSQIYCFEPVADTFKKLQQNLLNKRNFHCFNSAMGSCKMTAIIQLQRNSLENTLVNYETSEILESGSAQSETIEVVTISDFCQEHKIGQIDFLKIDTEGYDLEVLKGADPLLREHRITYIQVEAGMGIHNTKHVALQQFMQYLEPKGYSLFGIYGQIQEWWNSKSHLRFCNPVFISNEEITARSREGVVQLMY